MINDKPTVDTGQVLLNELLTSKGRLVASGQLHFR